MWISALGLETVYIWQPVAVIFLSSPLTDTIRTSTINPTPNQLPSFTTKPNQLPLSRNASYSSPPAVPPAPRRSLSRAQQRPLSSPSSNPAVQPQPQPNVSRPPFVLHIPLTHHPQRVSRRVQPPRRRLRAARPMARPAAHIDQADLDMVEPAQRPAGAPAGGVDARRRRDLRAVAVHPRVSRRDLHVCGVGEDGGRARRVCRAVGDRCHGGRDPHGADDRVCPGDGHVGRAGARAVYLDFED